LKNVLLARKKTLSLRKKTLSLSKVFYFLNSLLIVFVCLSVWRAVNQWAFSNCLVDLSHCIIVILCSVCTKYTNIFQNVSRPIQWMNNYLFWLEQKEERERKLNSYSCLYLNEKFCKYSFIFKLFGMDVSLDVEQNLLEFCSSFCFENSAIHGVL
jgi:uncharacterized membrane protein YjdF